MFTNVIRQSLSASHIIEGHPGKCANLHGHNWMIEVSVISDSLNSLGMVIDFSEIKTIVNPLFKKLDHSHLNDLSYFQKNTPTSENLAQYIYESLIQEFLDRGVSLKEIVVWETDRCCSIYTRDEAKL